MSKSGTTSSSHPPGPDNAPTIEEYRSAYMAADKLSREVANFRDTVSVPANNELRYAGYHFLQAVGNDGTISDPSELQKAINHCHRSMYEAADGGVITALRLIRLFQKTYEEVPVTPVISDYLDILRRADHANTLSAQKREHGDSEVIVSEEYINLFSELRADCLTLDLSRDELNKLERQEDRGYRRFILNVLLTILGILVAAFGVAATIYFTIKS